MSQLAVGRRRSAGDGVSFLLVNRDKPAGRGSAAGEVPGETA